MIELITGLPGNAKTLFTIGHVRKWADAEKRQVYYSGIPELTLDWIEIDPTKWMDCPAGSIVVVDECQKIFRNRTMGAVPPLYVTELETHRHKGVDLVFISQHPSLVDPAIRRLAGRHRHLVRIYGMEVSTVHKWDVVKDGCEKPAMRKDSEKTRWAFDKSIYSLYKSADQHTMKRSIPMRVKMLLLLPLVLIALGYMAYRMLGRVAKPAAVEMQVAGQGVGLARGPVVSQVPKFDALEDAKHFIEMSTPRVAGLPQTAPKYDELTKPVRVPVPAACIQYKGTCKCLTQQGTPMDVKFNMCIEFARNGFFQDFDPDGDKRDSERTARSVEVLAGKGPVTSYGGSGGGQVAMFGNPPADPPPRAPRSVLGGG